MPSQKNIEQVQKIKEHLKGAKACYFTNFTGLSVKDLEKLRRELKLKGGGYLVLKNTLVLRVIKDLGFETKDMLEFFKEPTGVAIAVDDPIALAKILKATAKLKIKGAILEGLVFNSQDVLRFAQIPSREILLSNLVAGLNLMGNLVGVLEGSLRNLITTIGAIKDKRG